MIKREVSSRELINGCKQVETCAEIDMPRNVDWSEHVYDDIISKNTSFSEDTLEGVFWKVPLHDHFTYMIKFDHGYIHDFIKFQWNKCYNEFNKDHTYKDVVDKIIIILDTVKNCIIIRHVTSKDKILQNCPSDKFVMTTNYFYDTGYVDVSSDSAYLRLQEVCIPVKSFKRNDIEKVVFDTFSEINKINIK